MQHAIRIAAIVGTALVPWSARAAAPPKTPPATIPDLSSQPQGPQVLAAWQAANHRFTPEVKKAWLASARASAQRDLTAQGVTLPADFLAWIDSDPVVQTTVYGARRDAAGVLRMLRSLEIDLGVETVRKEYTQLALATAVVHANKGKEANLTPRGLLKITIPGDPRKPVDTKDPTRQLDRNDHIINFLNAHMIEEEVVVGHREEPPPLRYDDKGIAIPPPKNAKPVKVPVTEKRKRTLYAADVMASKEWQAKFNAWMKEHGEDVAINCGDKVIHWKSTAAVRAERKNIADAFVMFRTAYEQKGLLPMARDPFPSPAEATAWLIRNDKHVFPPDLQANRKWPRFPLKAPWPVLTLLAADDQPLREREERWLAFRDKGEMRTYGEYIGPIAQQSDMQSARRLSPHPFHYGTYQMMAKDGGVCGTMANMGVRTYQSLGIPSCTAGQPGHCALIFFAHDPKTNTYECRGGQFATGGPDKTSPHGTWVFGDIDARKPMIWHQTVAWAVNHGFQSHLDTMIAWQFYRALPETERAMHGLDLLESALAVNPYFFPLAEAGRALAATPEAQIRLWKAFQACMAAVDKPGCPKDGLYNQTVRTGMFARLAKLPVPAKPEAARAVLAFLREEKCDQAEALVLYQVSLDGIEVVTRQTEAAFREHLAGARSEASCQTMAATLTAVANRIPDKKQRAAWASARRDEIQGKENYFGPKHRISLDASATAAAKLAGKKLAPEPQRLQPLLDQVTAALAASVKGPREPKPCTQLAGQISATAKQLKDLGQSKRWLETLAQTIRGHEEFQPKKGKPQRDPCATTIEQLLAAAKTAGA